MLARGLWLAVLLAATTSDRVVDHPCVADPVYPSECVAEVGEIGGAVLDQASQGFRNVVSPTVNPLLLLRTPEGLDGRLYALNPSANVVRVFRTELIPDSGSTRRGLEVLRDITVCRRPSALAQSVSGDEIFVACHGSAAIAVIDPARDQVVSIIQDRDERGLPRLQEPMGMVATDGKLYVASSQNNRIAVIDISRRRVSGYIEIPGREPRALALAAGGRYLIAANFLAGNRTEALIEPHPDVRDPETAIGAVCAPLLEKADSAELFDPTSPRFMDTTHEDYAELAECFLFAETFGVSDTIVRQPLRADHDLIVIDQASHRVVFTSDALDHDIGAVNYDVAVDATGRRVYLVATQARNHLGHRFGERPLVNQLAILDLNPETGALSVAQVVDLDMAALSAEGSPRALAPIPSAIAIHPGGLLITASGADALVRVTTNGVPKATIPVGFGPRGVVTDGKTAFVYNSTGLSVGEIDLESGQTLATALLGPSPLTQDERAGARLFNSAQFSANGSFACASCHPDGHLDGLVWEQNDRDGLRTTMTIAGIAETAPYHWDGSKCNLHDIVQDSVADLFRNSRTLDACELKTMSDFMRSLRLPSSPFRAPDDSFSAEATLGSVIVHRGRFKDAENVPRTCSQRVEDPSTEGTYLRAIGDPFGATFRFNGGGGPIPATRSSESCSLANCHVTPLAESGGFKNGDPEAGLIDGYQAVSTLGIWDRASSQHDGRTTREAFVHALSVNRAYHGADGLVGDEGSSSLAAQTFNAANFRHAEFNFDDQPQTHAFTLTDAVTRYMLEEQAQESAAVGLTVALRRDGGDASERRILSTLIDAASQGKLMLLGVGTLGGEMTRLTYRPADGRFGTDQGSDYSLETLRQAMTAGDVQIFRGALLPPPLRTSPQSAELAFASTVSPAAVFSGPRLRAVLRDTSPILCSEGYSRYPATLESRETNVTLLIQADGIPSGTRVLVDGAVAGPALVGTGPDFPWTLSRAPGSPAILSLQLMSPEGRLSNSLPIPVVDPVIPVFEPMDLAASVDTRDDEGSGRLEFRWLDQFGLTGPGTRYDVFRGDLAALRGEASSTTRWGECVTPSDWAQPSVSADLRLKPGEGLFYVVRARYQLGVSSWGSAARDASFQSAESACE